jgi:poly(3-hydroxybutyrate) depolymerase
MVPTWPNILTSGSSVRGVLAAALLTISALAGANAAEPRAETGFGSNPGNLRMFSYVPADREPAAPLIVVLHGCKQKAATFASDAGWLALADRDGLALLLPEQKGLPSFFQDIYFPPWLVALWGANNQNACFSWFQPEDTARDRGEALSIRQMIDATSCSAWSAARVRRSASFATAPSSCSASLALSAGPSSWRLT